MNYFGHSRMRCHGWMLRDGKSCRGIQGRFRPTGGSPWTGSDIGDPCVETETHNAVEIEAFVGPENCYRFDAPRRFRGYWISEFEGSEFVIDNGDYVGERIWLSTDNLAFRPEIPDDYKHEPYVIWLDVTGRITSASGRYGHMGSSTRLVLVDEVHEARLASSGVKPRIISSANPTR